MSNKTSDALIQRVLELLHNFGEEHLGTLHAFYDGELAPARLETDTIPGYTAAMQKLVEARQQIDALLQAHPEMKTSYETYRSALFTVNGMEQFEQFANGFSLAIRLIAECLDK